MKPSRSSRVMGPTSDLVVLAPWKPGIIGADEAILPRSRFEQTFDGLYSQRRISRESLTTPLFADPIERIEQVHSFRIVGREDGLLLAVTYDFGWEGYMRALWGPGGPFLDLMLANCDGYVPTRAAGLTQWAAWVRAREVPATYFYAATPLTVGDLNVLGQAEQLQRHEGRAPAADRRLAGFASLEPETLALARRRADQTRTGGLETHRQALRALGGLYRLTRFYGADAVRPSPLRQDAETLLRFAQKALEGWNPKLLPPPIAAQWQRELAWFDQQPPALPAPPIAPQPPLLANVQRGIVSSFDAPGRIVHGMALFLMVTDAAAARLALADLPLASEADAAPEDTDIVRNIAFSFAGLGRLGLPPALLAALPEAFRQGAAARAGQLGDVRGFHPVHWQPLPRNWPPGTSGSVDIDVIDAVIQLRTRSDGTPAGSDAARARLTAELEHLATTLAGVAIVSIEELGPADPERARQGDGRDHFGYRDGISQPQIGDPAGPDAVAIGDLLCGYRNGHGDAIAGPPELKDGSYLAIRRMPMHRGRFEALIAEAARATGLPADDVGTSMIGRRPDGVSPITGRIDNVFDYAGDPEGVLCPHQSHVRRVNPRRRSLGAAPPRIMRRGMSFGPPWTGTDDGAARGSLFMAYCADLAGQYEVLLAWLNGANSTRIGSFQPDPLFSPAAAESPTFRFLAGAGTAVHRCRLADATAPVVGLDWSLYLFAPSLAFMAALATQPAPPPALLPAPEPAVTAMAQALVARFLAEQADEARWRTILDEPAAFRSGLQRAVWEVIRERYGGVLVTADMVLVGSHAAVIEVMADDGHRFSVAGAGERIRSSIEKFHLGLDACSADYRREAPACNRALASVDEAAAFDQARWVTSQLLGDALAQGPARVDVVRHLLEPITQAMAPAWFGLPDGTHVAAGGSDWRDVETRTPVFPGDFWNASRYAFNPFTSERTAELSRRHGQAILDAVEAYVRATGRANLIGLTKLIADHEVVIAGRAEPAYPGDRDLARGVTGAMLGWVATTLGNGARLLDLWAGSGILARLQAPWLEQPAAARSFAVARAHFGPAITLAMMLQPVPENKWRVVAMDGVQLCGHALPRGRKLALGLQSAAADQAARGVADSYIAFGMNADRASPLQPPHGCPGRAMALGMLLGVVTALAETVRVRPAGASFTLDLTRL